ncbi:LysR family transcriptional regulator [Lapidilactobacillus wuchangensis]|uniref:LysR family transcriptional regulator n=1 Tax=Lapidilactobacillus wuchangensis TaxID=2486001 RepID=UPI000F778FF6|nr:LysR family transcriptional regulator [Lapidilactobacillus wuchangensis]
MIDNYLLEELVTFAKYGTLAATAEQLMVTQPTVTRGMQKLEEELGVTLFVRQPNRISLSKTGQFAAKAAQKALDQNQLFIDEVRKYELNQRVIQLGTVAPGPRMVVNSLRLASNTRLEQQFIAPEAVAPKLLSHDYTLIITNQELQTEQIEARYLGSESLSVNLDQFTYLANQPMVTFKELKGLSFIVLTDISLWRDIIQANIPQAKFLYQAQTTAFTEITKYSNFPYFSTNLSKLAPENHPDENDDRVRIPISDPAAKMDFYAAYLQQNRKIVAPLIKQLTAAWL